MVGKIQINFWEEMAL